MPEGTIFFRYNKFQHNARVAVYMLPCMVILGVYGGKSTMATVVTGALVSMQPNSLAVAEPAPSPLPLPSHARIDCDAVGHLQRVPRHREQPLPPRICLACIRPPSLPPGQCSDGAYASL